LKPKRKQPSAARAIRITAEQRPQTQEAYTFGTRQPVVRYPSFWTKNWAPAGWYDPFDGKSVEPANANVTLVMMMHKPVNELRACLVLPYDFYCVDEASERAVEGRGFKAVGFRIASEGQFDISDPEIWYSKSPACFYVLAPQSLRPFAEMTTPFVVHSPLKNGRRIASPAGPAPAVVGQPVVMCSTRPLKRVNSPGFNFQPRVSAGLVLANGIVPSRRFHSERNVGLHHASTDYNSESGDCGCFVYSRDGPIGIHTGGISADAPAPYENYFVPFLQQNAPREISRARRMRERFAVRESEREAYIPTIESRISTSGTAAAGGGSVRSTNHGGPQRKEALVSMQPSPSDYLGPGGATGLNIVQQYIENLINPWAPGSARLPDHVVVPTSIAKLFANRTYTLSNCGAPGDAAPAGPNILFGLNTRLNMQQLLAQALVSHQSLLLPLPLVVLPPRKCIRLVLATFSPLFSGVLGHTLTPL